ncbi:MAG: nucleoside hydrolase [Caldilineaceae bacterium]
MHTRTVPTRPPPDQPIRMVIDSDTANEIDDLYAIALAIRSPDRFHIEGFVATHFAQSAGRVSIQQSFDLLQELLDLAGAAGRFPVAKGGDPMPYLDEPVDSEGARLIVERAHAGDEDHPLWVLGLGAASNLASALILDPGILPKVRYVFHARSEWSWPQRSEQFNVGGDVRAARCLLASGVPLVWFDTGTQLTCPMSVTEQRLLPQGGLPAFLHQYRLCKPSFQRDDKGFFDLGDVAWMLDPSVCRSEIVEVPRMDWKMAFHHDGDLGRMVRLSQIQPEPVWKLFFDRVR